MAETKSWIGTGQTNDATATTANSQGTSPNGLTIVPAGAGTAKYSTLNPLIAGHASLRLISTATAGERCRAYFDFAATDAVSHMFAFRFRQDPGVATGIYQHVISPGTAGAGGLNLKSASGVRQLVFVNAAGTEMDNFGPITFGTALSNWYLVQLLTTKGTTTTDGAHHVRVYDYTGELIGEYGPVATVNAGTTQFVRTTWGLNTAVLSDFEVAEMKVVTDPPAQLIALPTAPPATPPALATPQRYTDKAVVTATATAGSGGTLTYTVNPAADAVLAPGVFLMARQPSTGSDYDAVITATEAPSGLVDNEIVTIPKLAAAAGNANAPLSATGANPGSTWA
jgi:hypothetical protein